MFYVFATQQRFLSPVQLLVNNELFHQSSFYLKNTVLSFQVLFQQRYLHSSPGGKVRGTWHSLFFTLQSNFSSAGFIRSSILTLCEFPEWCSFRRNRSTRSLSAALAQPHHAGAAYRRWLIMVALHTVNSALSCNPFDIKMRSAYIEEAHLLMMSSHVLVTAGTSMFRQKNRL